MSLKLLESKRISFSDLKRIREQFNAENQKIVFTNGCFDLIHVGHIDYLSKARDCGDALVIGVNSDDSVRRLEKGDARPIKEEHQRVVILSALQFVDYVVIFDEDTPLQLIQELLPDVLVKGGDYSASQKDIEAKDYIVGSTEVREQGGLVKVIPFVPGYSTSSLEKKIIDANL
mgnify:CR=1 FL=1